MCALVHTGCTRRHRRRDRRALLSMWGTRTAEGTGGPEHRRLKMDQGVLGVWCLLAAKGPFQHGHSEGYDGNAQCLFAELFCGLRRFSSGNANMPGGRRGDRDSEMTDKDLERRKTRHATLSPYANIASSVNLKSGAFTYHPPYPLRRRRHE